MKGSSTTMKTTKTRWTLPRFGEEQQEYCATLKNWYSLVLYWNDAQIKLASVKPRSQRNMRLQGEP
jgi:hypothetical protein